MKEKEKTTMNIVQGAVAPLPPEFIAKFRGIVGDKYAVTDAADIAPYVTEERDLFHGRSPLVLRPGSTAEVSAICKLASEHKIALVPQGGKQYLVKVIETPNGKVTQRIEAKLGLRVPGKAEILEGLSPNDVVITAGQAKVMRADGLPIKVVEIGAPASSPPNGTGRPASSPAGGAV